MHNSDICNENIFNSNYTKFKSCRHASWERNGLRVLGDLFEGNKLLSWQRFKDLHNIPCNFLDYHGLIHSLPKILQRDQPNGWHHSKPSKSARIQYLLNNSSYTKMFVKFSANNDARSQNDIARIESKWRRDVGDFESLSVQIVKNSIGPTRCISFQFKLVMRILTTNRFLRLINCRDDDRCTFCAAAPETLSHLFLECSSVQRYWNDISRYLQRNGLQRFCNRTQLFGDNRNTLIDDSHSYASESCNIWCSI